MDIARLVVMLTLACAVTAHFIVTAVTALYARYQVRYLSLAWINGIFAFTLLFLFPFTSAIAYRDPGILHPGMVLMLTVAAYFQSIYTLGIAMPGFLQFERMVKYALPILVLTVLYALAHLSGSLTLIRSMSVLSGRMFSVDMLLRVIAVAIAVYYVNNIYWLPRRIAYKSVMPSYLTGYCTGLGLSGILYLVVSIWYSVYGLCVYLVVFTLLNLYLVFRTLENMAMHLPLPDIDVPAADEADDMDNHGEKEAANKEDFNEMNLHRYHRVQYWMQHNIKAWTDSNFTRDRLCEETGINRQLMLQCLRSQGHNNVHDYLTLYRIEELKRLVLSGDIRQVSDCFLAGFGTVKTARTCFKRLEGQHLDDFISQHQK